MIIQGRRSNGSAVRGDADGQTDGRTDGRTDATKCIISLLRDATQSIKIKSLMNVKDADHHKNY